MAPNGAPNLRRAQRERLRRAAASKKGACSGLSVLIEILILFPVKEAERLRSQNRRDRSTITSKRKGTRASFLSHFLYSICDFAYSVCASCHRLFFELLTT